MYFLMSIKPKYADLILNGIKTVEIRRTRMNAQPGDTVVMYATIPTAKIVGFFIVEQVAFASTEDIWERFGNHSCLTIEEYTDYAASKAEMCAISIAKVNAINGKPLKDIERRIPQSFIRISKEEFQVLCALPRGEE